MIVDSQSSHWERYGGRLGTASWGTSSPSLRREKIIPRAKHSALVVHRRFIVVPGRTASTAGCPTEAVGREEVSGTAETAKAVRMARQATLILDWGSLCEGEGGLESMEGDDRDMRLMLASQRG